MKESKLCLLDKILSKTSNVKIKAISAHEYKALGIVLEEIRVNYMTPEKMIEYEKQGGVSYDVLKNFIMYFKIKEIMMHFNYTLKRISEKRVQGIVEYIGWRERNKKENPKEHKTYKVECYEVTDEFLKQSSCQNKIRRAKAELYVQAYKFFLKNEKAQQIENETYRAMYAALNTIKDKTSAELLFEMTNIHSDDGFN